MMKKVMILVVVLALGVAGFAGYGRYQKAEEAKVVSAMVADASQRVASQLDFFREARGATYREAIDAAEKHVAALDPALAQLAARQDWRDPALIAHATRYLKASQEAVRRARAIVMAKAELAATVKAMESAVGTLSTYVENPNDKANAFHADVASYGTGPMLRRSQAAGEAFEAAAAALGKPLSELAALRSARPAGIPVSAYLTDAQLADITISAR